MWFSMGESIADEPVDVTRFKQAIEKMRKLYHIEKIDLDCDTLTSYYGRVFDDSGDTVGTEHFKCPAVVYIFTMGEEQQDIEGLYYFTQTEFAEAVEGLKDRFRIEELELDCEERSRFYGKLYDDKKKPGETKDIHCPGLILTLSPLDPDTSGK